MPRTPHPTDSEFAILQVLWTRGPSTVRDVHEALSARDTGYTSTLKLMQIMAEKGLVKRDERAKTHIYTARAQREPVERAVVAEFVARAFGGSAATLVMHALSTHDTTPEELAEIERLVHNYQQRHK